MNGLDGLFKVLDRAKKMSLEMTQKKAMETVGALLESQTRERFESKKDVDGNDFVPWSPKYAKVKARPQNAGHSILENSGALRDDNAYVAEDGRVVYGTNVVYARRHNNGFNATPPQGSTPKRQFMGVNDANKLEIEGVISEMTRDARKEMKQLAAASKGKDGLK